jgi:hypothetical protein
MTNPNYTALLFVIDESGSMWNIAGDMQGGIKTLLEEQDKLDGKLTVDVAYFDDGFRYPVSMTPASKTRIEIIPNGMTALHDAIVRASTQFGQTLADLPEEERPGTVMVIIVTDGLENASKESTKDDVKALITKQQDEYNWNFVFLGANQDAVLAGESFGLRKGASLTYNASSAGVAMASASTGEYIIATRSGVAASFDKA